jgi:hypothetical protein
MNEIYRGCEIIEGEKKGRKVLIARGKSYMGLDGARVGIDRYHSDNTDSINTALMFEDRMCYHNYGWGMHLAVSAMSMRFQMSRDKGSDNYQLQVI